jgi:hypothetical protein
MRPHDELLLKSIVSPVLVIAGIVAFYVFRATDSADVIRKRPQWFAGNPAKRWTEKLFLYYAVFWISWFGIVVVSGIWEDFQEMSYFVVTFAMAAPCVLLPWYLQPPEEAARPFWQRYWVKANIWIAVISFVGKRIVADNLYSFITCFMQAIISGRTIFTPCWELLTPLKRGDSTMFLSLCIW